MNPLWFNWRTNLLFPMFQPGGARNYKEDHDGIPAGYYLEGFLFLQQFIFKAFMTIKSAVGVDLNTVPNIQIRVSASF
jgi:hypothetical protein